MLGLGGEGDPPVGHWGWVGKSRTGWTESATDNTLYNYMEGVP